MLRDEARMKAELFSLDVRVDNLLEPTSALGGIYTTRRGRAAEQSKSHREISYRRCAGAAVLAAGGLLKRPPILGMSIAVRAQAVAPTSCKRGEREPFCASSNSLRWHYPDRFNGFDLSPCDTGTPVIISDLQQTLTDCQESGDPGKTSTSALGLGRVKTALRGRRFCKPGPGRSQAVIESISGLIPTMLMTRVRLPWTGPPSLARETDLKNIPGSKRAVKKLLGFERARDDE